MIFDTVQTNQDGSIVLPLEKDSINWDAIPTAKPLDNDSFSSNQYTIDPFFYNMDIDDESDSQNEYDKLKTWLTTEGYKCNSIAELILKTETHFNCGIEWMQLAVANGFPLIDYLYRNPDLIEDIIQNTDILCTSYDPYSLWYIMNSIKNTYQEPEKINSPDGFFKVMRAFFERYFEKINNK